MNDVFLLHPTLREDTREVLKLPLCQVRLMNDRAVPWLILVPQRPDVSELFELAQEDREQLMEEVACASRVLERLYRPDKLNVAALGNLVTQLHIHVIARFKQDRAWPDPIWNTEPRIVYVPDELDSTLKSMRNAFALEREEGGC